MLNYLDSFHLYLLLVVLHSRSPLSLLFLQIMAQTYQNPNVVGACTSENRLEALEDLSERLDTTQKSLSNYLDTKRNLFPRFFFISDDELLSVLGSSDPSSIQVCSSVLIMLDGMYFFASNYRR